MEQLVAVYFPKGNDPWPPVVIDYVESVVGKNKWPQFNAESSEDDKFRELCRANGFEPRRHLIRRATGRDLTRYPFHYLSVRTSDLTDGSDEIETTDGCGHVGSVARCRRGNFQRCYITLKEELPLVRGFVKLLWDWSENAYLISKQVRELLEGLNATGYETLPVIVAPKETTPENLVCRPVAPQFVSKNLFQLRVTSEPKSPPSIGEARLGLTCDKCGLVYSYEGATRFRFERHDLGSDDFQAVRRVRSTNLGTFVVAAQATIVSERVSATLRRANVRGLGRYLSDPLISVGVVDIV